MGKIFEDIDDLAEEGGKYDIPESSPRQHEAGENVQPDHNQPYQHQEQASQTPQESPTFQHEKKQESQVPESAEPIENFPDPEDLQLPDAPNEAERPSNQENKNKEKIEPFDHLSREENVPDNAERFDHTSVADQGEIEKTEPYSHVQDKSLQPDQDQEFQHEARSNRPDSTSSYTHSADESLTPSEDSPFQHEDKNRLNVPGEAETKSHNFDDNLEPSENNPFSHIEEESRVPSENQPFDHTDEKTDVPERDEPFLHENNEELKPGGDEAFDHTGDEKEIPPSDETFDHTTGKSEVPAQNETFDQQSANELNVPEETETFDHSDDETDVSTRSQALNQREVNETEVPEEDETFDHTAEESDIPSEDEVLNQQNVNELEIPNEDDVLNQKGANESEVPGGDEEFEHTSQESSVPTEDEAFEHEAKEETVPSEEDAYDHTTGRSEIPGESVEFDHTSEASNVPEKDEAYEHEAESEIVPEEEEEFEHREENQSEFPALNETFQHEADRELQPEGDEAISQREQNESEVPEKNATFEHEEKNELSEVTGGQTFEHKSDEEIVPSDDEIFDHEADQNLRPEDEESFAHVEENEPQTPVGGTAFEHEERNELEEVEDDERYQHQADEDLRPEDEETFSHKEQNESEVPDEDASFDHEEGNEVEEVPEDETFQHTESNDLEVPGSDDVFPQQENNESQVPDEDQPFQHIERNESEVPGTGELIDHESENDIEEIKEDEVFLQRNSNESQVPDEDEVFSAEEENESSVPGEDEVFSQTDNNESQVPDEDEVFSAEEENESTVPGEDEVLDATEENESIIPEEAGIFSTQEENESLVPEEDEVFSAQEENRSKVPEESEAFATEEENESEIPEEDESYDHAEDRDIREPEEEVPGHERAIELNREGLVFDKTASGEQMKPFGFDAPASQAQTDTTDFLQKNAAIRTEQFDRLFNIVDNPPYILIRPDSDRADQKSGDSRAFPRGAAMQDQQRLAEFFSSPKGITFLAKQQALQYMNPRKRTRFLDPTSLQASALPGVHRTRHVDASESTLSTLISQAGFGFIKSSKYSDEIEDSTTGIVSDEDAGRGDGYLVYQIPNLDQLQQDSGESFAQNVSNIIATRIENVSYRYDSSDRMGAQLERIKDAALSRLGIGGGDVGGRFKYFLGTNPNDGFYTRDGVSLKRTGRREFLDYNMTNPYVENTATLNYPVGGERITPEFSYGDAFEKLSQEQTRNPTGFSGLSAGLGPQLSGELRQKLDGASEDIRSSKNVARAWNAADNNPAIAEYENLPKQADHPTIGTDEPVGGMRTNDDGDEEFFQNELEEETQLSEKDHGKKVFLSRGIPSGQNQKSYGMPNYGIEGKNADLIDELPVIDLSDGNNELANTSGDDGSKLSDVYKDDESSEEYEDLVPMKLVDKENEKLVVFRSFINSIQMNTSVSWDSQRYLGRPELFHIYTGADRELTIDFEVHPFSHDGLVAQYEKINYLQGMVYPSKFQFLGSEQGGNTGAYMVPPFMEITVGDLYRRVPGFISALNITPEADSTWSLVKGEKLPEHIEVNVSYTIIEEGLPVTGQKFIDSEAIEAQNPQI